MSPADYVRLIPRCAHCLQPFAPAARQIGIVHGFHQPNGEVHFHLPKYYHILCSPRKPDGTEYPPNTITTIIEP